LFSTFIETSAARVFFGDLLVAGMMIGAAVVALLFGVNAERRSLEAIATPLSARHPEPHPHTSS
jgi:hypothetical protein